MNIGLGAYVVMPNLFHGIICIGNNPYNTTIENNESKDAMHRVTVILETIGFISQNLMFTRLHIDCPRFGFRKPEFPVADFNRHPQVP
jgi:hypothetical protein